MDDVGKKMVAAIIYKYLKEENFPKEHVLKAFLSVRFAMTSSTLHKYIVGKKYKGGTAPGSKYRMGESEEWTQKQKDPNMNKGVSGSGLPVQDLPKGKGVGEKLGKKGDVAEICGERSKPKCR